MKSRMSVLLPARTLLDCPPILRVLDFQYKVVINVDNSGFAVAVDPLSIVIIQVDVSMQQIKGFKYPHKPTEGFETSVTKVLSVTKAMGSGVGDEHIKKSTVNEFVPHQSGNEADDLSIHAELGELVWGSVVPACPAQSSHEVVADFPDLLVYIATSAHR